MKFKGRKISPGTAEGEALVSSMGISFFGGVDPATGQVVEKGHVLEGKFIGGKVLAFPTGKGSTVGSYTLYRLKKANLAPAAIINIESEAIIAVGCIISDIPCVDRIPIVQIRSGMRVRVVAEKGSVEIL